MLIITSCNSTIIVEAIWAIIKYTIDTYLYCTRRIGGNQSSHSWPYIVTSMSWIILGNFPVLQSNFSRSIYLFWNVLLEIPMCHRININFFSYPQNNVDDICYTYQTNYDEYNRCQTTNSIFVFTTFSLAIVSIDFLKT